MSNPVVIAEEYTLPSLGKVYSENVNPDIKIRSMTTQEEMKRLSPSDKIYKNLCEIIDDCLVENPGISAYDMCLSDYQFLLHKMRVATYGSKYSVTTQCPHCLAKNDTIIDLNEIPVKAIDMNKFTKSNKIILPKLGKEVTLRMQTPRMADIVNSKSKELQEKSNNTAGDTVFLFTLESLIDTVDGVKLDVIKKEDFVRQLPMMDSNFIMQHAQNMIESFGLDTTVTYKCPTCGLDYTGSFRITSEFFRPRIHI